MNLVEGQGMQAQGQQHYPAGGAQPRNANFKTNQWKRRRILPRDNEMETAMEEDSHSRSNQDAMDTAETNRGDAPNHGNTGMDVVGSSSSSGMDGGNRHPNDTTAGAAATAAAAAWSPLTRLSEPPESAPVRRKPPIEYCYYCSCYYCTCRAVSLGHDRVFTSA